MQAWLESPVREAAVVYTNEQRAGSVWRPPYSVEVTGLLHSGENMLRIMVDNLAINGMAGSALPDYRLLNSRYGVRFTPQDMNNLQALPSGSPRLRADRLLQLVEALLAHVTSAAFEPIATIRAGVRWVAATLCS